MVKSPNYERLKVFMGYARANRGLEAWDKDHEDALKCLDDAVERLRAYRAGHGFTGATGTAMERWVDASINRITKYKEGYERGYKTYLRGRDVMATALAEAEKLSPDLLDAETAAMRDDPLVSVSADKPGTGIRFMGKLYTTGAAYVGAVEEQANEQREAAAHRIIEMLKDRGSMIASILQDQTKKDPDDPGTDLDEYEKQEREKNPGGGGGTSGGGTSGGGGGTSGGGTSGGGAGDRDWGYSRHDDFGRAADRDPSSPNYPGGFDQPWWSEADAAAARRRIVSSGAVETRELPYGELGSRTNPITDPQELMSRDLLHTRVNGTTYRNGVVGGHTPAPPRMWIIHCGVLTAVLPPTRVPLADSAEPVRLARVPSACAVLPRWAPAEPREAWPACVALPARPTAWAPRVPPPSRSAPTPVPASAPILPRGRKRRRFWCWRCWRRCRQGIRRIHGRWSRRWCWSGQRRQEASQAPVHGLQV